MIKKICFLFKYILLITSVSIHLANADPQLKVNVPGKILKVDIWWTKGNIAGGGVGHTRRFKVMKKPKYI